jgi:hypothetical protein
MWLGQFVPSQVNVLGFWAATEHRWIRGQLHTIYRRVVDALNADADQTLLVEQVWPHTLDQQPRRAQPSYQGGLAIPNLLYCVPIEDEETPAAPRDSHAWVLKTPERVELGLGPFEVTGYLHLPEGAALSDTLAIVRSHFSPLTEVTIRRLDDPDYERSFPVVVVNGQKVEYVVPARETADQDYDADPAAADQLTVAG